MKDKFTHVVVGLTTYPNGVGTAYMIGTYAECQAYRLQQGIRATTATVPF